MDQRPPARPGDPPAEPSDGLPGEPVGGRPPTGGGTVTGPSGDGGVIRRIRVRTVVAAGITAGLTVLLVVLGWVSPGWFVGAVGALIGGVAVAVCAAGTAVLVRRATLWIRGEELARQLAEGEDGLAEGDVSRVDRVRARCGAPVPLHRPRAGRQRWPRPRLPAHLLPVRAAAGPLSDGRALVLHPRTDALLPGPDDSIEVHALTRRGPFLMLRTADRAVFVADRWVLSLL